MPITIMRWPSRPAVMNKRVAVLLTVHEFRGAMMMLAPEEGEGVSFYVDVKWKGPKPSSSFINLRKSLKRGKTALQPSGDLILWDEDFQNECLLVQSVKGTGDHREVSFQSWEVHFVLRKVIGTAVDKPVTMGTVVVDLANFAGLSELAKRTEIFPVSKGEGGAETVGSLMVTLRLEDVCDDADVMDAHPTRAYSVGSVVECTLAGTAPPPGGPFSSGKAKPLLLPLLDDDPEEADEGSREKELSEKPLAEKDKGASKPAVSRLALGSFLSRGRNTGKENLASQGDQKRLLDALDLSVGSSQYTGDETEDDDCENDDALRYGRIVGVNLAVQNDLPIPALLPTASKDHLSSPDTPKMSAMIRSESSSSEDDASTSTVPPSPPPPSQQQAQASRRFFGMSLSFSAASKALPQDVLASPTLQMDQDSLSDSEDGPEGRSGIAGGLSLKMPVSTGAWAIIGKRKLGNRSPKAMEEPLLNKAYGEDGGDEIDWDRRKAEEAEAEHPLHLQKLSRTAHSQSMNDLVSSVFGEAFSVGKWERREVISRDGGVKLNTDVFFAGIDQCHESAAGEGACAALVAILAEWLLSNSTMPSKAEFDDIIKEGSAEWRRLCEVEAYKVRFADKHFDLETVVEARNGSLQLLSERSFVGFFRPAVKEQAGGPTELMESLSFLDCAMSFESIWEEISNAGSGVYILSWNDHFFVLVLEADRCYIVDTLGERLYEGCKQAYIIRFDSGTSLSRISPTPAPPSSKGAKCACEAAAPSEPESACLNQKEPEVEVSLGELTVREDFVLEVTEQPVDEALLPMKICGQFIKDFFVAVPLRELESDIEKGLMGKAPLHQRLQVECHYAQLGHAAP